MNDIGTGKNFPPENPCLMDRAISYSLVNFGIVPNIWLFMNILNRTRFVGKDNIAGMKAPWILMSNHVTLLDDLFIGPLIFFPKGFLGYRFIPYHAPEERNFYRKRLITWFMKNVKSIPLMRGRGIRQEGIDRIISAVKKGGILHIYPEGTRTRTGEIGSGQPGIGRIVYESGAPVVPLYHQGLEHVLPIGNRFPKFGREIRIAIGKPIRFDEELTMENNMQTWRKITHRVMEGIREQKEVSSAKWGFRRVVTGLKNSA
ncbi:1-acyl-sn-glycerol-3-phosphate acyltransferase [bacterium]|nr:1-acyl-sn-glycerol-3-phosphate acyltransferase [bacterium]